MPRELVAVLASIEVRFIVTSTYKAMPDNLAKMKNIPDIGQDYTSCI